MLVISSYGILTSIYLSAIPLLGGARFLRRVEYMWIRYYVLCMYHRFQGAWNIEFGNVHGSLAKSHATSEYNVPNDKKSECIRVTGVSL